MGKLPNGTYPKLSSKLVDMTPIKNVVASEQLVRFPLCKLASIATGDAKHELMLFLGYRDDEALSKCYRKVKGYLSAIKQSDLTFTNKIYVGYTDGIDPKFVENSTENYGVEVEKVGFNYPKAATAYINNAINTMTFRRITDIVDGNDINKSTKMIIISGAHFKGTWESTFDYRMTKLMKFHHIDGKTSRIPMMTKIGDFRYHRGNCEAVSIRFQANGASLTIVLPEKAKDLAGILRKIYLEKGYVGSLIKGAPEKSMVVTIPRFKIKTFVDWTGFLQGLGLYSIFNTNSSDLAGIYKEGQNKTIALSKIKQKVFIQIDEMGVVRRPLDPYEDEDESKLPHYNLPQFVADRPFYFEIAWDLIDGQRYELFSGVYYGPEPDLPAF